MHKIKTETHPTQNRVEFDNQILDSAVFSADFDNQYVIFFCTADISATLDNQDIGVIHSAAF